MNSYTPGPWKVVEGNCGELLGLVGNSGAVAMLGKKSAINSHDAALIAAAPELFEALSALLSNKHINLGDLVYAIREREGEGWDGPSVTAWSNAVDAARKAIAKARGEAE